MILLTLSPWLKPNGPFCIESLPYPVMAQVGREVRFQSRSWVAFWVLLGVALGSVGCYWFFVRDLNQVTERLDTIQQQVILAIPVPDTKPAVIPPSKGHHASHAAVTAPAP